MLKNLNAINFRNYTDLALQFYSDKVLFIGKNGAGKSNILEAIFFLSLLRSFRGAGTREMIRSTAAGFSLEALFLEKSGWESKLAVHQLSPERRSLAVDGNTVARSSQFIRRFAAVAFSPEDKMIVSGEAVRRRRWLDILISRLDFGYLRDLQNYQHALRQRNAALKGDDSAVIAAFEPELAVCGAAIKQRRIAYLSKVEEKVRAIIEESGAPYTFAITAPDDDEQLTIPEHYAERLRKTRERDMRKKFTSFGPQSDDYTLSLNGLSMKNYASNGQMRLFSLYLKMAELQLTLELHDGATQVIALVDDVTGELDEENRKRFYALLDTVDQSFFTMTDISSADETFFVQAQKIVIESGKVTKK